MRRLLVAVSVVVALVAALRAFLRRFLPRTEGVIRVQGLEGVVEILRDEWGVPHIYASSEEDLFFAQGYVHAQDRFWQMELQRRIGAGRLSEILGEPTVEVDRLFRVVGLQRAAEAELAALSEDTRGVLEAYAAGVNAYLQERQGRLSLEFTLLRYQPEPWRLVDSVVWTKVTCLNLGTNWASEVIRARLAGKLGAQLAADLEPAYPADNPTIISGPGTANGAASPPNGWGSKAVREALELIEGLLSPLETGSQSQTSLPGLALGSAASNQWAISGEHTDTGKPLLANDTHMSVSMPAVWYLVHLVGGRYDVAGVSFPGVPGVTIGHNAHCAWGVTIGWQDAEDLYVERFNPENPHQVEFQGRWHDVQVVREEIGVKGRPQPIVEEVVITRHGPIVSGLVGDKSPMALRWTALEAGDFIGSLLALDRAGSWEEFRRSFEPAAGPGSNWIYADVEGNIALIQAGWVPVRAKGYGIAPVPGWTGEYEWERYLTVDEMPQVLNPDSGWIGAANNLVVDETYPHFLSTDLENPCRASRLAELVTSQERFTPADFVRFQRDTYSAQAKRFVRHLLPIQPTNTREHQALALLEAWDYRMEPDSVAATIYQACRLRALYVVFQERLGDLVDSYVGQGTHPAFPTGPYHGRSFVRLLDMLDTPGDTTWLKNPETGIPMFPRELLHMALRQALKQLRDQLGDDMAQWQWGRLNQVSFAHPLGSVKPLHLLFNRGPYPMGGDADTLLRASGKPVFPPEPVQTIDALRFVADLSDWDRCRILVPGGQSGHVASRHYANLVPLWRNGLMITFPFSRQAVERRARERLVLVAGENAER